MKRKTKGKTTFVDREKEEENKKEEEEIRKRLMELGYL